jgi:threonine/homoserine/homoserine lactone efflux protein
LSVFFGYALAFSTALARRIYVKAHRWLNVMLSAVFAFAGFRLLLSRTAA